MKEEEEETEEKYQVAMDKRKLRRYLDGIRDNLRLMKHHYPGFTMRLYYEVLDPEGDAMQELCHIACEDPSFDLCDPLHNPKLGNATVLYPLLWRFLPVIDRQVDVFLSRDLDSRISEREV